MMYINDFNSIIKELFHIKNENKEFAIKKSKSLGNFIIDFQNIVLEYKRDENKEIIIPLKYDLEDIYFYETKIALLNRNTKFIKLNNIFNGSIHFVILHKEEQLIHKIENIIMNRDEFLKMEEEFEYIKQIYLNNNFEDLDLFNINNELYFCEIAKQGFGINIFFSKKFIQNKSIYLNNKSENKDDFNAEKYNNEFKNLFSPYTNKKVRDIKRKFNINSKSKNVNNVICNKIIENENKDFLKLMKENNIIIKTVRFNKKKKIKESMSFPYFQFSELYNNDWESSELYKMFKSSFFLFVAFEEELFDYKLHSVKLWKMPLGDLNGELKDIWNHTKELIEKGSIVKEVKKNLRITHFKNMSETQIAHVRPHARDSNDTCELPINDLLTGATKYMKHSFWLNSAYIEKIIFSGLINNEKNGFRKKVEKNTLASILENNITFNKQSNLFENPNDSMVFRKFIDENKLLIVDEHNFITLKYFYEEKRNLEEGTSFFVKMQNLLNDEKIYSTNEILIGTAEFKTFNEILKFVKINKYDINGKEYLTIRNIENITNMEAVFFILKIKRKMKLNNLTSTINKSFHKTLTENQVKSAVRNIKGFYENDLDMCFLSEDEYFKYIYNN